MAYILLYITIHRQRGFLQHRRTGWPGIEFVKPCDRNIQKTIQLALKMIDLAKKGDAQREDTGCGILYGILLDSAFRIKQMAERERDAHIKKGWWKE
jgi:hypothetical protein